MAMQEENRRAYQTNVRLLLEQPQGQEMVSALLARMLSPNTPFPMEEEHQ